MIFDVFNNDVLSLFAHQKTMSSFRIAYKRYVNICLKKTQEVAGKIQSLIAKEDIAE